MSLINAFRRGLAPVRRVSADIWAEENIVMTTETSAFPGPWDTNLTPYLREILEVMSPTNVAQRVVFAKGVQIGATASGILAMLTYADIDPCQMLYIMPTLDLAKGFSAEKLQPMIDSSESLKKKIKSNKSRNAGNTIFRKKFDGGGISIGGANSPVSLRSKSVRFIFLDEVDEYPANVGKQGSAISLAEKRTVTFGTKKKICIASTPTLDGSSLIWKEYLLTDQRKFHVPCPHCGTYQHLKGENLYWPDGRPQEAKYRCDHCSELIEEYHKGKMLLAGHWKSTVPEKRNPLLVGFHLNTLYSAPGMMTWAEIAEQYDKAMNDFTLNQDDNLLRTFYNTIWGIPYKEQGESPKWESLHERANTAQSHKRNQVLDPVLVLTAGVDVQKDRIEMEIVGWGEDARSWSIDYRVIEGDISDVHTQETLKAIFASTWTRTDGKVLDLHKICMDSNYSTTDVYRFCKGQDANQVIPTRGIDTQATVFSTPRIVNNDKHGSDLGRMKFYNLGVSVLKAEIYKFLKKTVDGPHPDGPPGYCHFPPYGVEYFKGLTAENTVTTWPLGRPKTVWHRHYRANEPLDCRNYARAALALSGYEEYGNTALKNINATYRYVDDTEPVVKKKRRSEYW